MPINSFLYPGASGPVAHEVDNSLMFDDSGIDSLTRTQSAGNRRTFTLSFWVKRSGLGSDEAIFNINNGTNPYARIYFNDNGSFHIDDYDGSQDTDLRTTRVFRDVSAWYHIVIAYDTTQSTASNRIKLYVNGSQETSFSTETYPAQNFDTEYNNNSQVLEIGDYNNDDSFNGYLSEVVMIDGTALAPTSFGEFDSDSPNIWKPIDVSTLTFGTNGFYLDFENSSSLGNDAAGSNNFTVNNLTAINQSTDTCTNNFCVLNPLEPHANKNTFSEGNIVVSGGSGAWHLARGTFGLTQGKWYWEVFFSGGTVGNYHAGVQVASATTYSSLHSQAGTTTFYNGDGGEIFTGSSGAFTTNDYGTMNGSSDILGVALNMDDKQITFYKNGSAIVTNYSLDTPNDTMMPLSVQYGSSQVTKINFGGTQHTAISSGNSDANGYGNFEYSVPSGYYSINSKNLAEFG